jgi:SAM-dependent MidA family methyltransferase
VLDAFPVHRLIKTGDELFELYVTLDAADGSFGPTAVVDACLNEFLREYSVELEDGQILKLICRSMIGCQPSPRNWSAGF